jgi:hypothetical protein
MNERGKPFSAADARKNTRIAMVAFVSQKLLTEEDHGAPPFKGTGGNCRADSGRLSCSQIPLSSVEATMSRRALGIAAALITMPFMGLPAWGAAYVVTPFDVPRATYTDAGGINDAGVIVGDFIDASGGLHGYLKAGSSFITIDVPGATRGRNMAE